MSFTYEIKFPEGYQKPKLPGRDLWTAALRSGDYQQGKQMLSENGYDCCLGVLCKIQKRPADQQAGSGIIRFDGDMEVLHWSNPLAIDLKANGDFPDKVSLVTFSNDPQLPPPPKTHSLTGCNDGGLNFNQIADVIEAIWDNDAPCWPTP